MPNTCEYQRDQEAFQSKFLFALLLTGELIAQTLGFVYPPQGPFFPGYNGRGEDRTIFADPQKPFVCLTPQAEPDGSTSCEAVIEVRKVSDDQVYPR